MTNKGDIIYWDGINPDGTRELPRYYIVTEAGERLEDLVLMDGDQIFFTPSRDYIPHFQHYPLERVKGDLQLVGGLPKKIQEELKKHK